MKRTAETATATTGAEARLILKNYAALKAPLFHGDTSIPCEPGQPRACPEPVEGAAVPTWSL
jgi:hypothetical protein